MELAPERFLYDVFLSYAKEDSTKALQLGYRLKEDGVRVWLDVWEIRNPRSRTKEAILDREAELQEGLQLSRTFVLLMSKRMFSSIWSTAERQTRAFRDASNPGRQFIPVRLDDAAVPNTIGHFAYIDWRSQDDQEYSRLLAACKPVDSADRGVRAPRYVFSPHGRSTLAVSLSEDETRAYSASEKDVCIWKFDGGMRGGTIKL
jgi:hypothetical protein